MKIMNQEERIKRIEDKLDELQKALVLIGVNMGTGRYEYERALQEFNRGNREPLWHYIEKGGKPHGGNNENVPASKRR